MKCILELLVLITASATTNNFAVLRSGKYLSVFGFELRVLVAGGCRAANLANGLLLVTAVELWACFDDFDMSSKMERELILF